MENKEGTSHVPDEAIYRIIGALNWPGEKRSLRLQADTLVEDIIQKRVIAKTGKALEEKIQEGKI